MASSQDPFYLVKKEIQDSVRIIMDGVHQCEGGNEDEQQVLGKLKLLDDVTEHH